MSELKLTLQSTSGAYRPGESIKGKLHFSGLPPKSDMIEIRLIWFTMGKGDRDVEVAASKEVTHFSDGMPIEFEFKAPRYPNSFALQLVSLIWAVEAIVFPDRDSTNQRIVISPTGEVMRMKQFADASETD